MVENVARFAVSNQTQKLFFNKNGCFRRVNSKVGKESKSCLRIKNQMVKSSGFSSVIITDVPLYESPGASFDQYLDDKPRVFKAMFPDKRQSQQLNEDEWRLQMSPIQFLFLTAWPVIDMKLICKTTGNDYPPGIPRGTTKVLELGSTRWKLEGLDGVLEAPHFTVGIKGALYPYRAGIRSRLKGHLEMNISFDLPPVLSMVSHGVLQTFAESVLKSVVEDMNGNLLADYGEFRREKSKSLA